MVYCNADYSLLSHFQEWEANSKLGKYQRNILIMGEFKTREELLNEINFISYKIDIVYKDK